MDHLNLGTLKLNHEKFKFCVYIQNPCNSLKHNTIIYKSALFNYKMLVFGLS